MHTSTRYMWSFRSVEDIQVNDMYKKSSLDGMLDAHLESTRCLIQIVYRYMRLLFMDALRYHEDGFWTAIDTIESLHQWAVNDFNKIDIMIKTKMYKGNYF